MATDERERRLYALQAELCQVLTEPARQELLHLIGERERTVGELVEATGLRQANVSQHLAVLRQRNVVTTRRVGTAISYSLAYPEILAACAIVRGILMKQLAETRELVAR
jgi:ArsR family transcriptional regulator, virulence genes transcriptional regulator